MRNFVKEFGTFISRGSLIEIAVGLLIATSFNGLVTSFADSFIMPIVNAALGFADSYISYFVVFNIKFEYGSFISALISFIIVGFVLFLIVKSYNKIKSIRKEEEELIVETELSLLKEIRDALVKKEESEKSVNNLK